MSAHDNGAYIKEVADRLRPALNIDADGLCRISHGQDDIAVTVVRLVLHAMRDSDNQAQNRRYDNAGNESAEPFTFKCYDVMGMPTDSVTCNRCGDHKTIWGERTWTRMQEWAKEHVCSTDSGEAS